MKINISTIKYSARNLSDPVTVFVSDAPGYLLEIADLVYSISLISGQAANIVIAGDDPLHQPAAVAYLLRGLRARQNIQRITLRTKHPISDLSSHMSPAWIWMDGITYLLDELIAAGTSISKEAVT